MASVPGKTYAEFQVYACDIQRFIEFVKVFRGEVKAMIMYNDSLEKFSCDMEFNSERDFLIFQNTLCIYANGVKYIS